MASWFKKTSGRYVNLDWVVNVRMEGTAYIVLHDGRSITLNAEEADRLRRHLAAAHTYRDGSAILSLAMDDEWMKRVNAMAMAAGRFIGPTSFVFNLIETAWEEYDEEEDG